MFFPGVALALLIFSTGQAGQGFPEFDKDVLPILSHHCFRCHGETARQGDLDLRTISSMLKGGSQGAALVPGSPKESLFFRRIVDGSMPMGENRLSEAEVRTIRDWIDAGALVAHSSSLASQANEKEYHWAFQTLLRPKVPPVKTHLGAHTPVDAFILRRLEEKGIQPGLAAEPLTLLRRLYLSLIGLPPTLEQQNAFLEDPSPEAYLRVVEDLLSRPQYCERWARHWLDVVRYAETNGYERDGTKPHSWRYRDYVIDSFNQDKPYDRFLTEQLAGDEIDDSDAQTQIATTFLRLGTWDAEPLMDRYDQLDDVLGVTATGLLTDLKRRGLLEETLVVWTGEFGRTPTSQNSNGRDHNPRGFSTWMAGGGVRGGQVIGATDDFGYAAVENKVHVHDLHATILHLMGLDHTLLTYFHGGRNMRLTDVHGRVVTELIA